MWEIVSCHGSRRRKAIQKVRTQTLTLISDALMLDVGIRPGTDKRDFQIHLLSEKRWIAAAGIRSTGLTSSLGIGRHVVQLLDVLLPEPKGKSVIQTTPLPSLSRLIQQYQQRRDGTVDIHGNRYRVTHPVTIFGWNEVIDPNTPESTLYNISSSSGQSKL